MLTRGACLEAFFSKTLQRGIATLSRLRSQDKVRKERAEEDEEASKAEQAFSH